MMHQLPLILLAISLAAAAAGLGSTAQEAPRAQRLMELTRPLVIAHRGYSQFAPENTLPAFELAKKAGADLVELDYYHTRDGVPIVFHDAVLDRTTNAVEKWGMRGIRVGAKTAAELQTLDAGSWFDPKYRGTPLLLLTEALDAIQRDDGVTLIERKMGDAATCARLLRERKLINQVIVQAFDWTFLRELHELVPEQILGALGPPALSDGRKLGEADRALAPSWIEAAVKTGARVVVWNRQVTRESVAQAHASGLEVWVYTINDAEPAIELVRLGVDGIITDNPAVAWRALALAGMR